jgi:N-acetylneuraminic acid mutarotase
MKTYISTIPLEKPTLGFATILACCLSLPPALADPSSWTRQALDMPMPLIAAAAAEVDGILYAAGGNMKFYAANQLATLFAYNPKTDSWTQKKDMPTARELPAASVVDRIVYVIGGGSVLNRSATDAVEAYDP